MVWEERWHPLRREWVVISSHRDRRPWQGETVGDARAPPVAYSPDCYLCPGNVRVSGERESRATPASSRSTTTIRASARPRRSPVPLADGPYQNRRADGLSRVVCYSPRHDLSLAELPPNDVVSLLAALQEQFRELAARPEVRHVLMFENKGDVVGVSNPHPHCQIYATNFVFRTIEVEADASATYLADNGAYAVPGHHRGRRATTRVGSSSRTNTLLRSFRTSRATPTRRSSRHARRTPNIASSSRAPSSKISRRASATRSFAWTTSGACRFRTSWPSTRHPSTAQSHPGFHFHIEIHTPLRKPGLLKYLAGPEIGGGNFLNDTAPEDKARELIAQSGVHYRSGPSHERRAAPPPRDSRAARSHPRVGARRVRDASPRRPVRRRAR